MSRLNIKSILISTAILAAAAIVPASAVINSTVAVCNPTTTTNCLKPDVNGALPVTGTFNVTTTALTNTVAPTYGDGTTNPLSTDTSGQLRVTGTFSANSTAQATTAAPSYVNATPNPLSQDLSGNLRTIIPGGVTVNTLPALPSGSNIVGNVRIDQTTPGTTNGVQINAALPIGGNLIGSVGTRYGNALSGADTQSNTNIAAGFIDTTNNGRTAINVIPLDFNGTTWDRKRGDVNGSWTQGNVASGVADAGNPVKVGAVFNTVPPAFSTGQRLDLQSDNNGNLRTQIVGFPSASADGQTNTVGYVMSKTSSSTGLNLPVYQSYFNGTSWDRTRGTVNGANIIPATNSETLPFSAIMAATTNATSVKASPGILTEISVYNSSATFAWLKLYNSASAPTCGSGTPVGRYLIPASANGAGSNVTIGLGKTFSTGIAYCVTGLLADADTTATAAGTMTVNFTYK